MDGKKEIYRDVRIFHGAIQMIFASEYIVTIDITLHCNCLSQLLLT